MTSVVGRIKEIKQPRGGYINPKAMEVHPLGGDALGPLPLDVETVHASTVGMAVDYLTRVAGGTEPRDAFVVSLMGARRLGGEALANADADVDSLTAGRVDDGAIRTACRLVGYDVVFRAGKSMYNPDARREPNATTVGHIRAMVERSLRFFKAYGPVTADGFTFSGGYTDLIQAGDGDFLTEDSLWEFKVSVKPPTNAHTLQLLIYYLMGRHSDASELFDPIEYLGVFNPRLDTVYRVALDSIPTEIIEEVSSDVIGYEV